MSGACEKVVPYKAALLKLAMMFIEHEAESLSPSGRVLEYSYVVNKMMKCQPGKALDVGCTARQNLLPMTLCLAGWEVYGIDKRRWRFSHSLFHFVREDVTCMSAPNETYDYAYAISTLEHIGLRGYCRKSKLDTDDDIRAVQEIKRVLKPRGGFVITVPYAKHYFKRGNARRYDADRLKRLIDGFKLMDKSFYVQNDDGVWSPIKEENVEKECVVLLELQK